MTTLGSIELRVNLVLRAFITLVQRNEVFVFPLRWTRVSKALRTRLVAGVLLQPIAIVLKQEPGLLVENRASNGTVDFLILAK